MTTLEIGRMVIHCNISITHERKWNEKLSELNIFVWFLIIRSKSTSRTRLGILHQLSVRRQGVQKTWSIETIIVRTLVK